MACLHGSCHVIIKVLNTVSTVDLNACAVEKPVLVATSNVCSCAQRTTYLCGITLLLTQLLHVQIHTTRLSTSRTHTSTACAQAPCLAEHQCADTMGHLLSYPAVVPVMYMDTALNIVSICEWWSACLLPQRWFGLPNGDAR